MSSAAASGIELRASVADAFRQILTPAALEFVAKLCRMAQSRRRELLAARVRRQAEIDASVLPDFLAATASVREGDWKVAPLPRCIHDRRVEITGPVDRKMVINAMNSGAKAFMADFEDSHCPTWANTIQGQINLRDAIRRTISFESPEGKAYRLIDQPAVLFVRPRGWHLPEKHVWLDGAPISGSLFDFGLYFFHNARKLIENGLGPFFYLPKLESHLEARLWNDVFQMAQDDLKIPRGTIKATVLVETILASFECDEILYELRDHSAGLNCGRWDYIFSYIKKFSRRPDLVLPDRAQITMTAPFMRAYCRNVIRVCHRRGAHAMGGMAAQIPIKSDPRASDEAMAKVRADKEREVGDGHDGTWVAHPGLVPLAVECFSRMTAPNQIDRPNDYVQPTAAQLIEKPAGEITFGGLQTNVRVGVQYLEAWLGGNGCVPLYNLMEDAATAEICRTQLWQWIRHGAQLSDGRRVTPDLLRSALSDELGQLRTTLGAQRWQAGRFQPAAELFERLSTSGELAEFLTLPAYEQLD